MNQRVYDPNTKLHTEYSDLKSRDIMRTVSKHYFGSEILQQRYIKKREKYQVFFAVSLIKQRNNIKNAYTNVS